MSINRVVITGNLTRDPELRTTATGMPVLGFGVAVNDRIKNSQGQWEDYPNFIDCTMFGKRAESLSCYLHKGTKVTVEGKLHYSQWERDGQRRSKLEVWVDDLEFMQQSQSRQPQPVASQMAPQPMQNTPQVVPNSYPSQTQVAPQVVPNSYTSQPQITPQQNSFYDEDIPF